MIGGGSQTYVIFAGRRQPVIKLVKAVLQGESDIRLGSCPELAAPEAPLERCEEKDDMAVRARRGVQALTDDACLLGQLDRAHTCTVGVGLVAGFNHGCQRQSITKHQIRPWITQLESGETKADTEAPGYVLALQLWYVGITEGWSTADFPWKQDDFQGCWLCKRGYDEARKYGHGISIGGEDALRAVARGAATGGSNADQMQQLEAGYWAHMGETPSSDVAMEGAAVEVAVVAPQTCCRCGFNGNRKGWKWMKHGEEVRCHSSNKRECRQSIAQTARTPAPDSTPPVPREIAAPNGPEVEMRGAEDEVEVASAAHRHDNMEEDSDEAQDQNAQQASAGSDWEDLSDEQMGDGWDYENDEDGTDDQRGGAPSTGIAKLSRGAMRQKVAAFVGEIQAFTEEDHETAVNALLKSMGGNHESRSLCLREQV